MNTPTTPTITSPRPGPKSRVVTVIAWLSLGVSVLEMLGALISWTVALVCAIGLLRRRDWARRLFTGLLGLAIVSVLFSFYLGQSMVWSLFSRRGSPGREIPEAVGSGLALGWLMIFGVVGLLLWLIVWFRSARVRAEFAAVDSAA